MEPTSRRDVIAGAAFSLLQISSSASEEISDSDVMAKWMDTWIANKYKTTSGTLVMSRFVEPIYYLRQPTVWLRDPGLESRFPVSVTVPVGFVTDLASIPRAFWSIYKPDDEYAHAAIVHDYLYWTQTTSRETADDIFLMMMKEFSVGAVSRVIIYEAVRLAGQSAWDGNAKARAGHHLEQFAGYMSRSSIAT
jgi:hypothetical protein